MRVLYWPEFHLPYIGGAEVLSAHFLPEMSARGHQFLVLTAHGDRELPDEEEIDGVPIARMHFRRILEERDLRSLTETARRVARIKAEFRPDLIHIHFSGPSALFHLHSASGSEAPTIVTVHHNIASADSASGNLGARLLLAAHRVVGVSQAIVTQLDRAVPRLASGAQLIYNGLAQPDLAPSELPYDPPVLLALGRLIPAKGFDSAIRAYALLKRRAPQLQMLIAGDGPERRNLEQLAGELDVDVTFLGWVEPAEVPALINRATVVTVPSRFAEPFGLVALQACQMARPVVATRCGGLPEIIVDDETGFLVEASDHRGTARAVARLLDDPALARRMGRAGRALAEQRFSMKRYASEYEAMYQQCVAECRGEGSAGD